MCIRDSYNRVFDSIDAREEHLVIALRDLENSPDRIKSIAACDWICLLYTSRCV